MKTFFKGSIILCSFLFLSCNSQFVGGNANKKKVSNLYTSILYKESYCKNKNKCKDGSCRPKGISFTAILLSSTKASAFALDACSFSILKQDCPFDEFSPICLEIFQDIRALGPK